MINSRRQLLQTAAALTGMAWASDLTAQDNAATNVADRTTTIKITRLRPFPAGTKAYVRIDTNHGISGWGEITGLEPNVAAALATSLSELLDGENPTRIEYLWQKIYRSHRDMRGGPLMVNTLSAIDMALWDITGKLWGAPVYRLLGGPTRERIRMYSNAKAYKLSPGGPYPHAGTPADIAALVARVAEGRKKVGPDGVFIFDAHCCLPPATMIQLANAIEPYDVLFIEEPAVSGNIEVFKRIKAACKIPLATGERDRTIWEALPYLHERAIDVLQPDCGHCGGITQMRKIATLAEAYSVPLAPHCTMSELGLTASLHAAAAIPHLVIHEGYLDGHIMPAGVATKQWEVDDDGYASLPQGHGLGVEMNEAKISEVNADPNRQYKWPLQKLKDGSISDY